MSAVTTETENLRAKHLQWCKDRALALLGDGSRSEINEAYASMISDLSKEKSTSCGVQMGTIMFAAVSTKKEMENFINGFN